jgi:hypothetical protein
MITAAALKMLTTFNDAGLAATLSASGYKGALFETAEFVGITNGKEFAYAVTFLEDNTLRNGKVFLSYDPTTHRVTADY